VAAPFRFRLKEVTMRVLLLLSLLLLGGCWNGNADHSTLDLGDVSLGQQFIDLKAARDAGAISADEYAALKRALIDTVVHAARETDDKDKSD
jgi:hypothetical protein